MEIVVLGANGTFPTPEGAATGFLVRAGGAEVWLDAGSGTFVNLQRVTDHRKLAALVLSHQHLDHVVDVFPFYYALRYGSGGGSKGLPVYSPNGTAQYISRLDPEEEFAGYFDFKTIRDGDRIEIGPMTWRFARGVHPVETLACRVEHGGRAFTYTSDTAPSEAVTKLAEGSDVLIAEASLQKPEDNLIEVHMTAEEAGDMAAAAKVGSLVLTHLSPGLDPAVSIEHASARFDGPILLATDRLRVEV